MKLLKKVGGGEDELENDLAKQNAIVEYYYGFLIDGHYPLMKKLNQLEHLSYMFETDIKRFGLASK